ncbi:MAG: hypothetical protein ACE5M4_04120 [Anaerolineales bacterium]
MTKTPFKKEGSSEGQPSLSLEVLLYALVVLLAIWLRFVRLDLYPLTDREAEHALAASSSSEWIAGSNSPAHRALTSLAFTLGGESEAAARWGPALAGVGLILTPALLRRQIGRGPAFLGALLLAISPVVWTASRTADGTSLAALGITASAFLLVGGRIEWSAAFLGLALVSGPAALTGLTSIGAGAGVFSVLRRRRSNPGGTLAYPIPKSQAWLRGFAIVGLIALLVATGAGTFPDALRGFFEGLGSWVSGWFQSSGVAVATLLVMLIAYEPLVSVAGSIGVVGKLRKGNALEAFLASWAVGAVLVLILYRGRQPVDIVWTAIPLTLMAALVISALLEKVFQRENVWLALGFTGAVVALMAFAYLQLRAGVGGSESFQIFLGVPTHFAAAAMGIGLAALALILLAVGWSGEVALPIAGAAAILVLLGAGISSGAALNFGEPTARELYRPQASTLGLNALRESLRTLSRAETGQPHALPIEMRDHPSPALAWAIRDYPMFEGSGSPAIVITREGAPLPGEYLGQSVTIGESWGWTGWLPPDLMSWLVIRETPTVPNRWVLLVRKDVAGVEELLPVELEP